MNTSESSILTIYNFSPFNNENLIANIKFTEESSFVSEFHISEADKNFRYIDKPYNLSTTNTKVFHHKIQGKKYFKGNTLRITRKPWFFTTKVNPWRNERVQRDFAINGMNFKDDDILIFSDIDEIIDHSLANQLIEATYQHQIITIKLRYTMYFFNLFSMNWEGPPDYSYRVFMMTGRYYKQSKVSIDKLRKKGESGSLIDKVFCFPEFAGFHHSWLGDEKFLINKLKSYSHDVVDHHANIYTNDEIDTELVTDVYNNMKSVYGDHHQLEIRRDIRLLDAVEKARLNPLYQSYFL